MVGEAIHRERHATVVPDIASVKTKGVASLQPLEGMVGREWLEHSTYGLRVRKNASHQVSPAFTGHINYLF